jgi:transposase
MLDAVFYVVDNGVKWRALPVDFPVWAPMTCCPVPPNLGLCHRRLIIGEFMPSKFEGHGVLGVTNGGSPSDYRCSA